MSQTTVNKKDLEALQKKVPRGNIEKTDVNLVRQQVSLILNMRFVAGNKPPTQEQLRILDEGTKYLRESFPTLYRAALEERQLDVFQKQLDELLKMIEKTQKKEMDYDEMTTKVGQTMFDRYVKPQVNE